MVRVVTRLLLVGGMLGSVFACQLVTGIEEGATATVAPEGTVVAVPELPQPTSPREPTATAEPAATADPAAAFLPYTDEQSGLAFRYPQGWAVSSYLGALVAVSDRAMLDAAELGGSGAAVILLARDAAEIAGQEPLALANELSGEMRLGSAFTPGAQPEDMQINGRTATIVRLTGAAPDGAPRELTVAIIDGGERFGLVAAVAPSAAAAQFGPELEAILGSVQLFAPQESIATRVPVALSAPIAPGDAAAGTIAAGTIDEYIVELGDDGPITVRVNSEEDLDAVIEVYAAGDLAFPLARADNVFGGYEEILVFRPDGPGTFHIWVRGFSEEGGDYNIAVQAGAADGYGTSRPGAAIIAADSLDIDEEHFFPVSAMSANVEIVVAVEPQGDLDVVLEIYEAGSETLLESVDASFGREELTYVLPAEGNYYLRVTGFDGEAGDYRITLMGPPEAVYDLARGDTVTGLTDASGTLSFFYQAEAGDEIFVTVEPDGDFDAVVAVHSLDDIDVALAEVDDNLAGESEALTITLEEGVYLVEVSGFAGQAGAFTLRLD